jgi:bifunctional DNA-binding transcriptional regulator/antitoxin component of YhaV-PrlF toxin-antitoxin module
MLIDAEVDDFQPRDRDIYDSTLQKSNQVYIPVSTREKLDLEVGDLVKYIVVPKDSFPGLQDGPIREAARNAVSDDEDEDEDQRPERETTNASFSGPMQKTGQVTVPADVMDRMGLVQGDTVTATVEHEGDDTTISTDIGTGNRIIIPKDKREQLGLEAGDEPQIMLAVFA